MIKKIMFGNLRHFISVVDALVLRIKKFLPSQNCALKPSEATNFQLFPL